jgi:four helix bundle protein
MHNFKELKVWQKAMDLTELVYKISSNFPKEEKFGLTAQVQRCSVSIPSNIAEGCGRNSDKDLQRFLTISIGSAFELETQMILANRFKYINQDLFNNFTNYISEVQKMIYGFNLSIENKQSK